MYGSSLVFYAKSTENFLMRLDTRICIVFYIIIKIFCEYADGVAGNNLRNIIFLCQGKIKFDILHMTYS